MKKYCVIICLLLVSVFSNANAAGGYVAAVVSTTGAGVDLAYGLTDQLFVRGMLRRATWNLDGEYDGVDYSGDLNLSSTGVAVDYYPYDSSFRFSGGVLSNGNEINLLSTDALTAEIGDLSYQVSGELRSDLTFNTLAPFFMLGFGNWRYSDSPISFSLELGVLVQGSPDARLSASGTVTDLSTGITFDVDDDTRPAEILDEEMAKEENNLNSDLDRYKFFPIISLGLSYRF